MSFHVPERCRFTKAGHPLSSMSEDGNHGAFLLRSMKLERTLWTVADEGNGFIEWEHVSVSTPGKRQCPTWKEMCVVKAIFWDPEDAVVQFHPPESDYVNWHPFCLHLWRPTAYELQLPPNIAVGPITREALARSQ